VPANFSPCLTAHATFSYPFKGVAALRSSSFIRCRSQRADSGSTQTQENGTTRGNHCKYGYRPAFCAASVITVLCARASPWGLFLLLRVPTASAVRGVHPSRALLWRFPDEPDGYVWRSISLNKLGWTVEAFEKLERVADKFDGLGIVPYLLASTAPNCTGSRKHVIGWNEHSPRPTAESLNCEHWRKSR
jgi:hypothetical protein